MKQKFYSIKNILKLDCEYNLLLGERSNGKSYAAKHHCIQDYLDNGNRFIYLRRLTVEIKNMMVEAYFNDVDVPKITKGKYELISVYRSGIYFAKLDEEGRIERGEQIGIVMALSTGAHYKSMSLLQYKNIIFEEFISSGAYLPDEPNLLQQLVSTVVRRTRGRVFLIGNTISRLCPYFNEWSLVNIPSQKQGTIDIYRVITDQKDDNDNNITIKIAVEICANSGNNSKMFFGSVSKAITAGAWESYEQPHIPYPYDDCEKIYSITIIKYNMMYCAEILKYNYEFFVFVHPTNKIRTHRIIQSKYDTNMFVTSKLVELTKGDRLMKKLFILNKICFSDNLTGTEFTTNILPNL